MLGRYSYIYIYIYIYFSCGVGDFFLHIYVRLFTRGIVW